MMKLKNPNPMENNDKNNCGHHFRLTKDNYTDFSSCIKRINLIQDHWPHQSASSFGIEEKMEYSCKTIVTALGQLKMNSLPDYCPGN